MKLKEVVCVEGGAGEGDLSNVILQDEMVDRWVWKLHSSQRYTVKSAYNYLTTVEVVDTGG